MLDLQIFVVTVAIGRLIITAELTILSSSTGYTAAGNQGTHLTL